MCTYLLDIKVSRTLRTLLATREPSTLYDFGRGAVFEWLRTPRLNVFNRNNFFSRGKKSKQEKTNNSRKCIGHSTAVSDEQRAGRGRDIMSDVVCFVEKMMGFFSFAGSTKGASLLYPLMSWLCFGSSGVYMIVHYYKENRNVSSKNNMQMKVSSCFLRFEARFSKDNAACCHYD